MEDGVDCGGGGAVEGGEGHAVVATVGQQLNQVVSRHHTCWHQTLETHLRLFVKLFLKITTNLTSFLIIVNIDLREYILTLFTRITDYEVHKH